MIKDFSKKVSSIVIISVLVLSSVSIFLSSPKFTAEASPDTETLRPNAAGSETSITTQYPASTEHWDKVDEETPDDDSTYVRGGSTGVWQRDLYALPAHTGSGTINNVTVYARLKDGVGSASTGKISIRTNGATYDTSAYALTTSWANFSNVWTSNPNTSSSWTWDEIDALEAGISLYQTEGGPSQSILKGQLVLMADGSQKNIEDVQVGDEIISFDLDSQKPEKDKVVGLGGGPHNDYLIFNGILRTSLNHFIWANGEYKPAENIKIGEFITNSQGQEIEVTQIQYVLEKVDTYDLEIEKNHNFFASNYLVHNAITSQGYSTQVYVVVDYTPAAAVGPGMASTNYKIGFSSINVGGSDVQVSTPGGYKMADTIGEVGTGVSTSSGYKLNAGYRQMDEVYLSLTVPVSGLTMDQPNNMGISVNTVTNAAAGAVWNVKTDAPAGYTFSFRAEQTNCLRDGAKYFDDYSEASPGTPDAWSVDSNKYEFGFSVFGDDAPDGTWGIGSSCLSPASNNLKYRGFDSTNNIQVASSGDSTSGTDTVLCAAAEQKDVFAPNGVYTATVTATAISQ